MPIWKVSQSEESAALVALASPQPSSISWHHRADAVLKPCEHEAQIAPPPEQRAMERSRIDPALRALPGATIARIKARVIPRERHNIDNGERETQQRSAAPFTIACLVLNSTCAALTRVSTSPALLPLHCFCRCCLCRYFCRCA